MSYTPPPPPPEEGEPGDGSGATPPGYGAPPPPPGGYGGAPPPPPVGYGGPPPGYGGQPRNDSKAVTALVIGILSSVLGLCCGIFGLVGIAAILLGRSSQKEIAMSGGALTGEGMAKAGVILGIIGCAVGVIVTIVNIVLYATGTTNFDFSTY